MNLMEQIIFAAAIEHLNAWSEFEHANHRIDFGEFAHHPVEPPSVGAAYEVVFGNAPRSEEDF